MNEKFTFFLAGPFSQWHPSKFVIEGIAYNCCEQWMMASKARLFNDLETEQKILNTLNPREQKQLGRQVKNFNDLIWREHCQAIVYKGNYAKFSQNKKLAQILMTTKGTTLVECNPKDPIWGVGLDEKDSRRLQRSTWQGSNLLGEMLTKVREDLIIEGKI